MYECPYCSADLNGSPAIQKLRTDGGVGRKSPATELVTCPECDGVIDGFTAH